MQFEVSDLLFPGFTKDAMKRLDKQYGIEFFYEFGKDYYWKQQVEEWGERALSIHAPCVALNFADSKQKNYARVIEKTFAYAQKCKADFVVVHTNEAIEGDKELLRARVIRRLRQVMNLGKRYDVKVLIENVGLRTKNNVLFDLPEYVALFDIFPQAGALLDTGHAHVNGWDIPAVVKALGERLAACHVHDNDGNGDAHLPVGQGDIDWKAYFGAVKKYAPQATQVFEYCCGFNNTKDLEAHIAELKEDYKL
ncbi:sugar phosphate isomerase/epimerase family protein [Phascolarctobacterium succinatutens]|jgi:sugar phosphate isomerase/epimerase|uniref:sugar phosphate isomerase/epimerase family protein n=1 Tax=Phascolarctobacterium succinatutens TaxID=626940 RepID=UPI0023F45EE8|nr:sugar phosphate isomerase/epimerase family protein [Phascolarctobacterium succinatutens]